MSLLYSSIRTMGPSILSTHLGIPSVTTRLAQMLISKGYSSGTSLSRQEIEERVLQVLSKFDRVNQSKLSLTSQFTSDLGLDSLDVVEVIIALEEQFHLEIPDNVADKISNPVEAVDYIYKSMHPS